MGVLFDLKSKIDKVLVEKKLDNATVRGKIGLQAGFLLTLVTPSTPDDPVKIDKLKKAAEAATGVKF
jgi:hypothetical protein